MMVILWSIYKNLAWHNFGSSRGCRVVSRRKCQKLPQCSREATPGAPGGPCKWPGLSLAVMVVAPVGKVFKKEKKWCTTAARREERGYVKELALQTPRSVKKEVEDAPQTAEQRLPCACDCGEATPSVCQSHWPWKEERQKERGLRFVSTYYYPFMIFYQ